MKIQYLKICLVLLPMLVVATKAQDKMGYEEFLAKADKNFGARADKMNQDYQLGDFRRWDYLQEDGKLRFSDNDGVKLVATAQILGSYSTYSATWMWSWANKTIDPAVRKDMIKVKEFGQKSNFKELTEPQFECGESHAWKLTSAAGELLDAKGAYRGQIQDGWVYFLIMDIKRVDK